MRLGGAGYFWDTFSNQSVCDDKLRLSVITPCRDFDGVKKLLHVLSINLLNIKAVGLETSSSIFALSHSGHRIKSDRIAVVDQDQVIEAEMSGESARFS